MSDNKIDIYHLDPPTRLTPCWLTTCKTEGATIAKAKKPCDEDRLIETYKEAYLFAMTHSTSQTAREFELRPSTLVQVLSGRNRPKIREEMVKNGQVWKPERDRVDEETLKQAFEMACRERNISAAAREYGFKKGFLYNVLEGRIRCHIKAEMNSKGVKWERRKHNNGGQLANIDAARLKEIYKYACGHISRLTSEKYGISTTSISRLLNGLIYPEIKQQMEAEGYIWEVYRKSRQSLPVRAGNK